MRHLPDEFYLILKLEPRIHEKRAAAPLLFRFCAVLVLRPDGNFTVFSASDKSGKLAKNAYNQFA
jgi:hypothetical protein